MSEAPSQTAKPKKRIYVALATYANQIKQATHQSLVQLYMAQGRGEFEDVEFIEACIGGDGVARSRNWLMQDFILNHTEATHFLCLDVDIRFTPAHIRRLIDADKDIVGGLYAAKQMNHRWIMTGLMDREFDPSKGVQEVQETGTGLKLIKRCVPEAMIQAFPEIAYMCDGPSTRGQVRWDFFSMGVVEGRYLSEDYYFDYRARKIGFKVHVDSLCQVAHTGSIDFPFTSNVEVFDGMTLEEIYNLAVQKGCTKHREADDLHKVKISA